MAQSSWVPNDHRRILSRLVVTIREYNNQLNHKQIHHVDSIQFNSIQFQKKFKDTCIPHECIPPFEIAGMTPQRGVGAQTFGDGLPKLLATLQRGSGFYPKILAVDAKILAMVHQNWRRPQTVLVTHVRLGNVSCYNPVEICATR